MGPVFFTPGPSQLHPRLHEFLEEALDGGLGSISHRSAAFKEIYANTENALRSLLGLPRDFTVAFVGSATEAMERILQGSAGKRSHHFVNGAFSRRFKQIADALGLDTSVSEVSPGAGFSSIDDLLSGEVELACLTHNETSTGVVFPHQALQRLRERNPNTLIAVDVVSSTPAVSFDYGLVDCAFFSVQKGFGLPAGLGVLLFNDRCVARARELASQGSYTGSFHGLAELARGAGARQTSETPNVLAIYVLGRVAGAMHDEGASRIHEATARKAEKIYHTLERHEAFAPFVRDEKLRSETVIAVRTQGRATEVRRCARDRGLEVGSGYGSFRDDQIRIANFPAHSEEDVDRLLAILREFEPRAE